MYEQSGNFNIFIEVNTHKWKNMFIGSFNPLQKRHIVDFHIPEGETWLPEFFYQFGYFITNKSIVIVIL